jgi:hypothetical protein
MSLQSLTTLLQSVDTLAGFSKKYKKQCEELYRLTSFLPESSGFRQRTWHILHNVWGIPNCDNCDSCVKWHPTKKQYNNSCSVKCANNKLSKKLQIKKTTKELYGNEIYSRTEEYIKKRDFSNMLRHGTTNPNTLSHIQLKRKTTLLNNYGVSVPLHSQTIKERANQTNLLRYGTIHPISLPFFQQKALTTKQKRFNRDSNTQVHISSDNLKKLCDYNWLFTQHITKQRNCVDIGNELGVYNTTIHSYLTKHTIPIMRYSTSTPEIELQEMLVSWGIPFTANDRSVIHPLELDIYIPSHKLAIEYCGLYWHSDIHDRIDKNYHKRKMDLCHLKGINLITIFEDEWIHNKELIIDKLQYKLNLNNKIKTYARNTDIKIISTTEKVKFLNAYHIQGSGPGSITIGLLIKKTNELVAVMTLMSQKNNTYVLNRYATSHLVVGGFSKLLKYFTTTYEWNEIVTFADRRWSEGELYTKNKFNFDSLLPPDYSYIKGIKRYHKFGYRRKFLLNKLKCFNPELSEKENCDNNGILRIWDCGKLRYVMKNTTIMKNIERLPIII